MVDYEKVCWYCGSKAMFPIQSWFKCDDCGATHVPSGEITDEGGIDVRKDLSHGGTSYSPSKRSQNAARKARGKDAVRRAGKTG